MLEHIKAIFLDADNTIINHKECEKQALTYLFEKIGISYREKYQDIFRPLDRNLWDSVAKNNSIIPKEQIPEYRFQIFFKQIEIEYTDYKKANELFQEGLANSSAIMEDADKAAKYLLKKGYKLYVITNGLVKLQKPRITNSKMADFISDIIVSEEVGVAKPNPEIFNFLLKRIQLKPNEVVMIGDSLEKDIKGAQEIGIKTIWYHSNHKENNTNIKPDYEIGNWLEIKSILP